MTTREVVLDGGSPWGFRLHGGADLNQPLRISRVNPGSKAALRGIREGDFITSINNQSTKDITNAEAHTLLRNSGDTLKLGLNEDTVGSPRRRQYKTIHQETHSETVKKSSITSYTVTSSLLDDNNKTANSNINGNSRPPISSSSSSSTSTYTSITSPSGMADNGKKRKRNRRKNKTPKPEEYKVESPKRVKSPEKKPIKSRSFDDDLVIQEVSESDDKNDTKPVITEAESDPETPRNLPLPLEDTNYTEEASVMSPEEELTLRNFLEGLNLVNSPEDAFKQVHSTMESIKSRRAQKRAILEQYFNPIVQNPRFLDVINEETSDLSDREQSLTHHLKQGTPEPEITPKIKKLRKTPPNPAVLVGTRIIEVPKVTQISSTSTETSTQPEIVFLEDSSDSTTPDPKSDEEGKLEGGVGELTPPPTPKNEEIDLLKSCSKEKVLIESEITQDLENVPNSEIHKISSQNLDSSIEFAQLDTATKPVDKAEVISQASKSISDSEKPKSFTINQNLENTSNTEVNEAPAETEIPSQKPNFKCKIENIAQKEDNSEIHKFSSHNLDSSIEFAQLNTPTKPIDKAEIISKASKSISDSEEPQSSVTNHQNLEYSRFTSDETLPVDSKSRSEIPNQDTNSEKNIAQNVDQKEADSEIQEFCIQNLNSAKEFAQISQKIDDRQASKSISDSEETKSFVITQNVGNSCISEDNTKNIAKSVNLIQDSRSSSSNSEKQHLDTFKEFAQLDPSSKVVDKSQNISQNKASRSETVGHKKLENSTCSDQLNKPEIYFQKIDLDEAFKSTASVSTENKNLSSSIEFAQLNPNKVVEPPKNIDQNKTSPFTTSNSKIQKVFTKNLLVSSKSVDNSEFFSPKTSLYEASKSTTSDSEIQNFSARNQKSKIRTDFSHLNLDLNSNFSKSISTSLDSRLFKNMEEKISEPVSSTTSESEPKQSCKTSFSKKDPNYNYKFVSTPNLQNIFYFDNFPKTEIFNNSKTEDNKCFSKCTTSFKSEKEFEKHFTSLQFSKRVNSDSKKAQSMTNLDKTISSKSVPKPREYVHKIILSDENSKSRISPKPENINASNIEVASYKSSSKPREYVHKIILSDEEENKRSKTSSKSEYFKASSKPKEYIHKIILSDDEDKVSRHRTSSKSENIDTSTINLESSKPNEYTHKIILSDDNSKTSSKPEDRNACKLDPETIKNSEIITSKSISHSEQFSKPREYVHKIILSDEESKSDLDVKRSAIKYKNFEKSSKPREYIHKIILPDKESKNSRTRASTKSENINLEYYKPKEFTHNIILCDENSKSESRPKSENLDVFKKDIESEITSFKPKEYIHQVILSDTETTSKSENIYLKSSKSTKRSENTEKSSKPKEYIHEIILSDKETSSKLENIDLETSKSTENSENLSQPKEYIHQIILSNEGDSSKSENLEKSKPKEYIHKIILSDREIEENQILENVKIKKSEVDFAKPPKPETLESPSREVEKICSTLTRPQSLIYTNVLTPPAPTPSPSLSSGSSRATSCTAKYNPSSSIGDITSITQSPPTLREICLNFLISQPFGADILQELADVSSSIEKLTSNLLTPPPQTNELDKCRKSISVISSNYDERQDRSNRLLAIIRDAQPSPPNFSATLPRTTNVNMASARLKAKDLTEWLKLARNNSNENRDEKQTRRTSLPQEFYFQQMHYLQQKEKEIQNELQQLENEKRKLEDEIIPKFRIEDYHISKKGDFAESRKNRPVSMPTEFFRQQMYEEYMEKIAEMEERKQQKLLKVSQVDLTTPDTKQSTIADEFMTKVKQKQQLGQLQKSEISENEEEDEILPKHLQEFISLGVWSPGQKPDYQPQEHQKQEIKNEPISPVWTPKSATSSPTVERKEFRPIKFESPTLSRKNYSKTAEEPPWKAPETSSETGILLSSTLEKRLPTSQSAPISGFNDFPTTRLPKAQNPTITLLQKAREGQLPKGALYIDQEPSKRPLVGPGEILYKIKNEYTSESESEKPPRKMADLGPRKFEGIGPTTKDGMPLILRSEVKDANQSKWYKRMYDTIHKQKPHRDEFVTVRYKQRRGQYPYTSGYLSEPEPGAYDSDFTDYKYATLDRRRQVNSATMPKPETVVKHGHDLHKNQPGRIENYIPGHSSISEKEAKEWWDEVMDIFDGHLEQQKRVPQTKSFINQALKESGYESDSTLVFRRRDETSQLSPSEQKEAYKIIQKGGDIPLHGLRKPAPERPKEEPELEYFPISPTLTRIRIHKNNIKPQKEIFCYPVTIHPHPSKIFANYKRTAPSSIPPPPSPPRRKSSRNNSTLRLISTMKVKSEKSPICKRHETCFTTTSRIDNTNVKLLRDKITCKLSSKTEKPKIKLSKVVTTPEVKSRLVSTLSTTNKSRTVRTKTQKPKPQTKTFGTEKKKVDLVLPKVEKKTLTSSPDLLSPNEVKKAVEIQKSGTIYRKTNAVLPTKTIPIKVGITEKGKTLLKSQKTKSPTTTQKVTISTIGRPATKPKIVQKKASNIKSQKEVIQNDNFFQHLFLRDLPSPPLPKKHWLAEKTSQKLREPTISAMKVYLKHTKPVTDSKFRSLDLARSRSASPKSVTFSEPKTRSSSLPPKLVFSQTSRPVTPPLIRSPSSRKIMQLRNQPTQIYSCPSVCQSTSSIESCDRKEYQNYVKELVKSSRKSPRFKDLNEFYAAIEKFGKLEQTASLKPRTRFEDEIIDYDRWKEVRSREKAEKELQTLVSQLKISAKEKGFVFCPKEVEKYRWKKEFDRGLRIKEKSVDNIKEEFEKLKLWGRKDDILKDTYKPLWRGDSVLSLANKMVERRSQSEGRVPRVHQKLIEADEKLLTHGIGSRIWSSLSSEQINILKNQLTEIYGSNLPKEKDYSIQVPAEKSYKTSLTVRRNSDSDKVLSENEKKLLSQTLSKEVMDHVKRKIVLPKETMGALVSASVMSKSCPPEALIKTDCTKICPVSETESGSTDESTKTVIQKKVEYFENVADEKFSPTIYKPADEESETPLKRQNIHSQSYQNLKELFGEKELMKFATVPLSATRKQIYTYPSPPLSETDSFRSRSLSPYFDEPLALVKTGEVRRLKEKFEFPGLTYPPKQTLYKPRRWRSDSNLYTLRKVPGNNVEFLRSRYEYPVYVGRGRSRVRRGVVSPTFLRAEDRFMPHINIISKIANLYSRKQAPEESYTNEELARILGCPIGEVEKMRQKFENNVSLLGHMFTSSPNIKELRDIAPYLAASWIAHRFPRSEDNTRSLSSPESLGSRDTSLVLRKRPKSTSPLPKPKEDKKRNEQRYRTSPQRPSVTFKEPEPPVPPPKGHHGTTLQQESPRKYVENEVTIHYKTPVRQEIKEYLSEDELAHRQAEAMKKIYQEERRRKYLQVSKSLQELQDMNNRRHTDNFIPSQKSPIPLNRYDDFDGLSPPVKPRPKSPEPRLMARALYNFVGQTSRELTFRKGDLIYVRRQVDKNWYEGELNAMVGLFPVNYVEIVTYDNAKSTPRKSHEGQARAKYNFVAQTHLELSLAKGELVVITRRVDDNWFEGKIGGRKGIFPVSYVEVLIDPSDPPLPSTKPVASPAAHSLLLNGSSGGKESMGSHSYTPNLTSSNQQITTSYHAKPVQISSYGSLSRGGKNPVSQALHIETQAEPIPYRALYKYLPQNDDELELLEGDTVYVLEKCDDGWYVGSSDRTGAFGTFPGNYVEKI